MITERHERESQLATDIVVLVNQLHTYAVDYYHYTDEPDPNPLAVNSLQRIKDSLTTALDLFTPIERGTRS